MFTFILTPDDGEPYKVPAGSRDVYVWEKTGRGKTFAGLMENMAMVDLYDVAFIAARRQKLFTGDMKEFTETVELATEEDEAEKATPFPLDLSVGNSSPSPSTPASPRTSGRKKDPGQ